MTMRHRTTRWMMTLAALGALVALPACDRDDHDDHEDLAILEVLDRTAPGTPVVATWTLGSGWTGQLPTLVMEGDNPRLSLGFNAITGDGDALTLDEDGEFYMQYWLATGAPEGVIDIGRTDLFHGDHVHVYPVEAGTTEIRFELWHVDHVEQATAPIEVTVTAGG